MRGNINFVHFKLKGLNNNVKRNQRRQSREAGIWLDLGYVASNLGFIEVCITEVAAFIP